MLNSISYYSKIIVKLNLYLKIKFLGQMVKSFRWRYEFVIQVFRFSLSSIFYYNTKTIQNLDEIAFTSNTRQGMLWCHSVLQFSVSIHHVTFFVHLKRGWRKLMISRQSNLILSNLSLENNKTFLSDRVHALQGICF